MVSQAKFQKQRLIRHGDSWAVLVPMSYINVGIIDPKKPVDVLMENVKGEVKKDE